MGNLQFQAGNLDRNLNCNNKMVTLRLGKDSVASNIFGSMLAGLGNKSWAYTNLIQVIK